MAGRSHSKDDKRKCSRIRNMMNAPHKDVPARPSKFYLDGILEGYKDNQIPTDSVMKAVKRTRQEVKKEKNRYTR